MKSDLPLCRMREAREKWTDGEAETKTPLTVSSLRTSSSEVVVFMFGNFRAVSLAFRPEVTQTYFSGTPR